MVLSGRSLTMEETPAEEVDNAEPWGTKADFPRVLLDLHKFVYIYIVDYWCLYSSKIETNECQTNLIAERLDAMPS